MPVVLLELGVDRTACLPIVDQILRSQGILYIHVVLNPRLSLIGR
jgi:hypothetical protein